jgi:hypothetical protein
MNATTSAMLHQNKRTERECLSCSSVSLGVKMPQNDADRPVVPLVMCGGVCVVVGSNVSLIFIEFLVCVESLHYLSAQSYR